MGGPFGNLRTERAGAEQAFQINGLKTGALFGAAVGTGALVAGADEATRHRLGKFALEMGLGLLGGAPS